MQESISFKPVKPTVKPTLRSTPVPWEMLKAVVATNKAENAVRCWLIKMVLFRIKKKKDKSDPLLDSLVQFKADQLLTWKKTAA